ncbi:ribosomal protein S18-alanine N-acetyltransferase [Algibacillus agarilyticus]|uniref:ribosomal protein S18-alanine N-acetyltransferase n=1 Tax=Algibacillus agarilyticus TaxID=2234133 RepID=UPI000DCFE290|nr:ribosomal protein S18-alanine N-acetyltransferase [Algibacillus agarilyticus]
MYKAELLTIDDADAILDVELHIQAEPLSLGIIQSCFGRFYKAFGIFAEQELIGYAIWQNVCGDASLINIAVKQQHQGKGVAKALMQAGLDWCRATDAQEIWLEVRVSNTQAIKLYERCEFIEHSIRENYYPTKKGSEDALVMVLILV